MADREVQQNGEKIWNEAQEEAEQAEAFEYGIDAAGLDGQGVKNMLVSAVEGMNEDAHAEQWKSQHATVKQVYKGMTNEHNKMVKVAEGFCAKYEDAAAQIEAMTAVIKGNKEQLTLQKSALDKCETDQRQLRNDRNKEISAANADNWSKLLNGGGICKTIVSHMSTFIESDVTKMNVDQMKTAFRACSDTIAESKISNDTMRKMLNELKGGDDKKQWGPIFKALSSENDSELMQNVNYFPYYKALSKQAHWFMVSRKAVNHRKTIERCANEIANNDRALQLQELKQQAYSVYDDLMYTHEDLAANELYAWKKKMEITNKWNKYHKSA